MKITLMGTKIDLTPSIKQYVDDKVRSIEKLLVQSEREASIAQVQIGRPSARRRKGEVYYAEVNLQVKSALYRASSEHYDVRAAIDKVRDDIKGQIRKKKTKDRSRRRA